MKSVLLTGGTGFIGRNVVPIIGEKHRVFAPMRNELDLMSSKAIRNYIRANDIDVLIHAANPNPVKNPSFDSASRMCEDSLRMFLNVYQARDDCEKVIYLGSGAEYDKRFDISQIREADFGRSIPVDAYGLSKYVMTEIARSSKNVFNLRVFACYGPDDHETKFITHCIRSVLRGDPITIRQDCRFDYLHVYDLARVISSAVDNELAFHDYNVASGKRLTLSEIASAVMHLMNVDRPIRFLRDGLGKEYTANVDRLACELGVFQSIGLQEGLAMQIEYETEALG